MTELDLYNEGYDVGRDVGYNMGYDVGFEDGFKELQGRIKELETQRKEMIFKLALSDLALQRIENISGRFVGSDEKSEALKKIQEFCVQVLKELEAKLQDQLVDMNEVTRVEVIDDSGRSYMEYNAADVQISIQDYGRTLKVFLKKGDSDG